MAHNVVVEILVQLAGKQVFKSLARLCFPNGVCRAVRPGSVLPLIGRMQFQSNFADAAFGRLANFSARLKLQRFRFQGAFRAGAGIPQLRRNRAPLVPRPYFVKPPPALFFAARRFFQRGRGGLNRVSQ